MASRAAESTRQAGVVCSSVSSPITCMVEGGDVTVLYVTNHGTTLAAMTSFRGVFLAGRRSVTLTLSAMSVMPSDSRCCQISRFCFLGFIVFPTKLIVHRDEFPVAVFYLKLAKSLL